jgi:hypothetical protein
MGGMFSKPKRPRIPQAPEIPKLEDAEAKARAESKKKRQATLARGRQSTIFSKTGGFEPGSLTTKKAKMGGGS